jgi:hypothetical protein
VQKKSIQNYLYSSLGKKDKSEKNLNFETVRYYLLGELVTGYSDGISSKHHVS